MDLMGGDDSPRIAPFLTVLFLAVVIGGSIDLLLDRPVTLWSAHVLFELALIALSLGAALWLARGWRRSEAAVDRLTGLVREKQAESDAWQRSAEQALDGLSRAIDAQCALWGLTPTERETALLLLKGHSHKRIARLTDRSERTVRQHAVAVYRKSGLSGRAELAAFFLEGLRVTPSPPTDDA
ncbi:MAG: helix-turn-helix domain-containing protein [Gemmatimonadota bacterium]|jgi:DNA-binding CsgD family transcriptional regulator